MPSKLPGAAPGLGLVAREALGMALPAGVALVLFLLLSKEGGSQGEPAGVLGKEVAAPLCGQWHRGGGETSPVDLTPVRQAYRDLGAQVRRSLERIPGDRLQRLDLGTGADLPACRETLDRRVALPAEKAAMLRGRTWFFAKAGASGERSLPTALERDPQAEVLLLGARSVLDLAELRKQWGCPVTLADAEFAKALGVRCLNTWVRVSEKGDGLELHEAP